MRRWVEDQRPPFVTRSRRIPGYAQAVPVTSRQVLTPLQREVPTFRPDAALSHHGAPVSLAARIDRRPRLGGGNRGRLCRVHDHLRISGCDLGLATLPGPDDHESGRPECRHYPDGRIAASRVAEPARADAKLPARCRETDIARPGTGRGAG